MSAGKRVARSYAPIGAVAALFLAMTALVAPVTREERGLASTAGATGLTGTEGAAGTAGGVTGGGPGATVPGGAAAPGAQGGAGGAGGGGGVQPCPDRAKQVTGDPYSPPCSVFSGDNGGATSRGVTKDTIVVAARELEGPTAGEIFAQLSGESVISSPEAVKDTVQAFAEYFSKKFDLYGRTIKIEFYKGQGSGASELLGGGKEAALADAVHVSKEIGAFADISGITLPYADALAKQGIVNIGAPYPSRQWFMNRAPYAWSIFPDGTNVVESAVSDIIARQPKDSRADYAGPSMRGKPRRLGLVAPENQEYQESVEREIELLRAAGINPVINLKYKLDISSMPNQASNIIAQLKDAGVTSVACGCDPVMLALGLTPKANEQDYEPEWLSAGLAFVDQDIVSQLIEPKQWSRAFGIAYNAESEPQGRSFPYAAYKTVRPNDEPAFGVEELYYQMYVLAIGLQMAGPNLTPQTFAAGMFAYPGGSGPRGFWHFSPTDFTTTDDFRELWWDPNRVSGQNNKPGAWVQLNGGRRYKAGGVPVGPANWFKEG